MYLQISTRNGIRWWCVTWDRFPTTWWIGRVSRLPTMSDALRIVNNWNILVIEGRPYYRIKDRNGDFWKAYDTV